jgi:hypothetical protein
MPVFLNILHRGKLKYRYYLMTRVWLEGLRKTAIYISQGSWYIDRDSNRDLPKSSDTSPIELTYSVRVYLKRNWRLNPTGK